MVGFRVEGLGFRVWAVGAGGGGAGGFIGFRVEGFWCWAEVLLLGEWELEFRI